MDTFDINQSTTTLFPITKKYMVNVTIISRHIYHMPQNLRLNLKLSVLNLKLVLFKFLLFL